MRCDPMHFFVGRILGLHSHLDLDFARYRILCARGKVKFCRASRVFLKQTAELQNRQVLGEFIILLQNRIELLLIRHGRSAVI